MLWFAAASRAVTVITFTPNCNVIPFTVQLVVPTAAPLPHRSQDQLTCVTETLSDAVPPKFNAAVDVANGPSHIIGIAFDGYPIYGDRDIDGKPITASQLDQCNGITSPTPEFPKGTYHYVLLVAANSTSSIRCFSGTVSAAVSSSMSMSMSMPMSTPGMSH